jgi:hypothetical protein
MWAAYSGHSCWILPNMPLLCNISTDGLSFVGKENPMQHSNIENTLF